MGKDSAYYKEKNKKQLIRLRELLSRLPSFAVDYIYSKEVTTQTSTLVSYSYDLITFFEFLSDKNPMWASKKTNEYSLEDFGGLSSEDIIEFQRYLEMNIGSGKYHENSKRAIARKMAPLRGLYLYHYKRKNIPDNPMDLVALPRVKKDKNIVRMNNYEVQAILSTVLNGDPQMSERQRKICEKTKKRDYAILSLMLGTGIRVSECVGLDLNDVDLIVNSLTIVRKGGGQDVIYFDDNINSALGDYIENERNLINPLDGEENALFFSLKGKRMSVDAIENLVKKYSKMVVPTKKITPHKLRSTYGTALYRATGDIRLVADVLGHENINTTINYYAAIEDEHKRKAVGAVDFNKPDDDTENP